jgi:hypothetical protein
MPKSDYKKISNGYKNLTGPNELKENFHFDPKDNKCYCGDDINAQYFGTAENCNTEKGCHITLKQGCVCK